MREGLTALAAVVDKLLAGDHPALHGLRLQAADLTVESREMTGVGFFTTLTVNQVLVGAARGDYELDDVLADVEGLNHGAGFVLYVRNGVMDLLEGYCYDEPWPPVVGAFALNYHRLPRALRLSRDGGQRTTQVIVSVPD
jgi:hypothetical protein